MKNQTQNIFHPIPIPVRASKLQWLVLTLLFSIFISGCAYRDVEDDDADEKRQKSAESNTALGQMYMERGQYEVAFGKLKKAVSDAPDYAPAHTVLAVLYELLGEPENAGKHFKLAYEADPKSGDTNNNYGTYLCKQGKTKEAIRHFRKSLDDPFYGSPEVALTNAGSCELGAGNLVDANTYLRQALKTNPTFPDALLGMAQLSYREGDYLKSRAFIQRYESAASHTAASLLLAFNLEISMHDTDASAAYMFALESNFPESEEAAEARSISGR
jgi:type IV pilus assembly protein PilF